MAACIGIVRSTLALMSGRKQRQDDCRSCGHVRPGVRLRLLDQLLARFAAVLAIPAFDRAGLGGVGPFGHGPGGDPTAPTSWATHFSLTHDNCQPNGAALVEPLRISAIYDVPELAAI